jgi:hypothetical protein
MIRVVIRHIRMKQLQLQLQLQLPFGPGSHEDVAVEPRRTQLERGLSAW